MKTPVARVLGGFSALDRRLGSIRILRVIPSNWVVLALLLAVSAIFAVELVATLRDTERPEVVAIDRLLGGGPMANRHVEVTGLVFPEARAIATTRRRGIERPSPFVYLAMLAPSGRVLLVRFPSELGHGQPRIAAVRGLLRPPDRGLSEIMESRGWTIGGAPVESRFLLIEGMTPKPPWVVALMASAFALPAAGLLASKWCGRGRPLSPEKVPSLEPAGEAP